MRPRLVPKVRSRPVSCDKAGPVMAMRAIAATAWRSPIRSASAVMMTRPPLLLAAPVRTLPSLEEAAGRHHDDVAGLHRDAAVLAAALHDRAIVQRIDPLGPADRIDAVQLDALGRREVREPAHLREGLQQRRAGLERELAGIGDLAHHVDVDGDRLFLAEVERRLGDALERDEDRGRVAEVRRELRDQLVADGADRAPPGLHGAGKGEGELPVRRDEDVAVQRLVLDHLDAQHVARSDAVALGQGGHGQEGEQRDKPGADGETVEHVSYSLLFADRFHHRVGSDG